MAIARKLLFVAALVLLGASPAVLGGVGGPGGTSVGDPLQIGYIKMWVPP